MMAEIGDGWSRLPPCFSRIPTPSLLWGGEKEKEKEKEQGELERDLVCRAIIDKGDQPGHGSPQTAERVGGLRD